MWTCVAIAETRLCLVDGAAGRLVLRGHDLADLADWSFEVIKIAGFLLSHGANLGAEARRQPRPRARVANLAQGLDSTPW